MASSANPYQNYSQPQVSDHNDDLIDPDNGKSFGVHLWTLTIQAKRGSASSSDVHMANEP